MTVPGCTQPVAPVVGGASPVFDDCIEASSPAAPQRAFARLLSTSAGYMVVTVIRAPRWHLRFRRSQSETWTSGNPAPLKERLRQFQDRHLRC